MDDAVSRYRLAERSKRLLRWIGCMEHVHETSECRRVRSLFISDVHLGSRFAQADAFLAFLEAYQVEHASALGCHGVVCGHIHTPALTQLGDINYCNTGDWVENCSALLEFDDGELRLARFCRGTGMITHHDSARSGHASETPAAVSATEGDSHPSVPPVKLRT